MTPLEQAIRAICSGMGANPDEWAGFAEMARVGLSAFLDALPPEVAAPVWPFLETPPCAT